MMLTGGWLPIAQKIVLFFIFLSTQGFLLAAPKNSAVSAVVYDVKSGVFLYQKNGDTPMRPASTVKLLTAMVVLDRWPLDKRITVPKSAETVPPYRLKLKHREKYSVRDLIYALLMRSGNDVAHTLAVRHSGSEKKFAAAMNKKAKNIGASHAYFANPHGLPANKQHATAKDLALITARVMDYDFMQKVLGQKYRNFKRPSSGQITQLETRNKLLLANFSPPVLGKTGYTDRAGRCFAGYTTQTKTPMVIVLLHAPNRWDDLRKMAVWCDSFYRYAIHKNKKWLSKNQVIQLQKKMTRRGYYKGTIDGVFGTGTEAAVIRYQSRKKLKVDGLVGKQTLKSLGL